MSFYFPWQFLAACGARCLLKTITLGDTSPLVVRPFINAELVYLEVLNINDKKAYHFNFYH